MQTYIVDIHPFVHACTQPISILQVSKLSLHRRFPWYSYPSPLNPDTESALLLLLLNVRFRFFLAGKGTPSECC